MILALAAVAALAWWLHKDGLLLPNLRRFGVAAGAAIVALRLAGSGEIVAALLVAAGGVWWWTASRPAVGVAGDRAAAADEAAARALLGVPPGADAGTVHAAWRQALAAAHPDRGGTAEGAAALTAARDLLLRPRGKLG